LARAISETCLPGESVLSALHVGLPVELMIRNAYRSAVGGSLLPPCRVALAVREHPASEDDEVSIVGREVGLPTAVREQGRRKTCASSSACSSGASKSRNAHTGG
jgi:hypothetical protein